MTPNIFENKQLGANYKPQTTNQKLSFIFADYENFNGLPW